MANEINTKDLIHNHSPFSQNTLLMQQPTTLTTVSYHLMTVTSPRFNWLRHPLGSHQLVSEHWCYFPHDSLFSLQTCLIWIISLMYLLKLLIISHLYPANTNSQHYWRWWWSHHPARTNVLYLLVCVPGWTMTLFSVFQFNSKYNNKKHIQRNCIALSYYGICHIMVPLHGGASSAYLCQ
jgi:hypothetical protein